MTQNLFGMRVRVADSENEWRDLVAAAQAAAAQGVGRASGEVDLVIDQGRGWIIVNPKGGAQIIEKLREQIPEKGDTNR